MGSPLDREDRTQPTEEVSIAVGLREQPKLEQYVNTVGERLHKRTVVVSDSMLYEYLDSISYQNWMDEEVGE